MKYKIIILLSLIAYSLNFVWESIHSYYLYDECNCEMSYFFMMSYVSLVDTILILIIFYIGTIVWKDFYWFKKLERYKYIYIFLIGSFIASLVEIKGVYIFKEWSYSSLMPTIFGIGLSPFFQLSFTGIVSIITISMVYKSKK